LTALEKENELKRLLESGSDAWISLALYDLASGYQLLVHPDAPFHPASTFKLGVMMEVFHQPRKGSSLWTTCYKSKMLAAASPTRVIFRCCWKMIRI
jgi:beta-lactamase class A